MNQESELRLQSYLDGELSPREARRVAAWLDGDPEAQALLGELKMARTALAGNEPELHLPESREFYWSKIRREIERAEKAEAGLPRRGWLAWRKYLVPFAGTALVAILAISTARFGDVTGADESARHLAEVENLSEHTGSYSFRSHAENMFVVWVYDQNQEAPPEPEPEADLILQ